MVDVTLRDGRLRATDPVGNAVTVELRGWEPRDPPHGFDVRVTSVVGGVTAGVRFTDWPASVRALDDGVDPGAFADREDDAGQRLGGEYIPTVGETLSLPEGAYRLRVETHPFAFLRADGPLTVESDAAGVTVSFETPTPVTLGFRSNDDYPDATVTVPRTPAGLATALDAFPAALRTTGADRSFPTLRGHPPLVEFGEEDVPEAVRADVPDVDVAVEAPAAVADLLAVAPLSYYLGASVSVADRDAAVLRFAGEERTLPPAPAAAPAARRLLHRTFGLDCLVRNAGEYGTDLAELDAVPEGFAADWYDEPPAARLARYLEPDLDDAVDALAPLRYAATVEPRLERATVLPHLLNDLAPVRLPDEPDGGPPRGRFPVEAVVGDVAAPAPNGGERGREGEGLAFETRPAAYDHQLRDAGDDRPVVLAAADPDRADALRGIAATYRERSSRRVRLLAGVERDALAAALDGPTRLLHYVGDCDPARGLRCADGWLDPAATEPETTVLVLDAPRSLDAARTLVDGGGVAALATDAGDGLAATATFGGLLLEGMSVAGAAAVARHHGALADHVRVVGDGAFNPRLGPLILSAVDETPAGADDPFELSVEALALVPGSVYRLGSEPARLAGNVLEAGRSVSDLRELATDTVQPLVLDGSVVWPEEADRLLYPFA